MELTVSGGTVSVTGDAANGNAVAAENVTVSGGSLTAVPAAGDASTGKLYYGIQCTGSLTMTGGAIRVDQPAGGSDDSAIRCNGTLTLTGGSLTASGAVFAESLTLGDGMSAVGGFQAGDDLPLTFEDGRFKAATNEGNVQSSFVSVTGSGAAPFTGDQTYVPNSAAVVVDGADAGLEAISIYDTAGNGYTYFKLRDLGDALGFGVDWDQTAGVIVIDTKG